MFRYFSNATGGEPGASFRSPELQALFDQFGHKLTANGNILLNIPNAGARVIINADNVDNFARALANRYAAGAGGCHYHARLALHGVLPREWPGPAHIRGSIGQTR
jgi:hypothetical protein